MPSFLIATMLSIAISLSISAYSFIKKWFCTDFIKNDFMLSRVGFLGAITEHRCKSLCRNKKHNMLFLWLIRNTGKSVDQTVVFMYVSDKKGDKVYTSARKQMLISALPPVVTLHLKRFHQVWILSIPYIITCFRHLCRTSTFCVISASLLSKHNC